MRTAPNEQVLRCKCKEHRRLYVTVTTEREGERWAGKLAIYKDAGPIAERYRKTCRKIQEKNRKREQRSLERSGATA